MKDFEVNLFFLYHMNITLSFLFYFFFYVLNYKIKFE